MKTVIVRPERCVGCLQCRFACAVAHSKTMSYYLAPYELVVSKPRIHIGLSSGLEAFPNKCRHCDPAPCESACISKAIFREPNTGIILINPDRCINCGMCSMACPFGVVRYHVYPTKKRAAHKCDQCILRQSEKNIPACVEVCMAGALIFEDENKFMDKETSQMASVVYQGIREKPQPENGYKALKGYKSALKEIKARR